MCFDSFLSFEEDKTFKILNTVKYRVESLRYLVSCFVVGLIARASTPSPTPHLRMVESWGFALDALTGLDLLSIV
jgi:hypothetical protein